MTTVTVTLFGLNWVYLAAKKTGYSDIPLIVTLLAIPKGVCTKEVISSNASFSWTKLLQAVFTVVRNLRAFPSSSLCIPLGRNSKAFRKIKFTGFDGRVDTVSVFGDSN